MPLFDRYPHWYRSGLIFTLLGVFAATTAQAEPPQITGLSPRAVRPGEAVDLTIQGKNLADATQLWTSFPAEVTLAPDVKDNGKQADRVVYRVRATDPRVLGVHGVRVVTPNGVSPLQIVVVDDLPSLAQQPENTTPEKAQQLSAPMAVDGVVQNLSRHYYRFSVQPGQRLTMEVLARRMGSALDPMIRLFSADGRELAYNDDAPGLLGDARLCHTFPEAGQYVLEVRDVRFQGGGNFTYRLRIGDFPCVNVPYPMGVKRGQTVSLEFAGPDVDDVTPVSVQVPSSPEVNWLTVGAKRSTGTAASFATVSVGDAEELLEAEPNNQPDQAQRVPFPANYNGRLQEPGDVDRFVFAAKNGEKYLIKAVTRSQGSPADVVLRLFDAKGKQLAESDDAGSEDAVLETTFVADGDYQLSVEDLHGRGGTSFAYRIAVDEANQGFVLEATGDAINVPQGGGAVLPIVVKRMGFNGPIALRVEGLPEGVTAAPAVIGTGQQGINLCLQSTAAAKPGTFSSIRVLGTATVSGKPREHAADISRALKATTNQLPYPPANLNEALAAAVAPAAPFSLRTEPAEVTFGPNLTAKFKVIATRQEGFNDAIALAVKELDYGAKKPAPGLPPNVTAALKPIPKDQQEIEITLTATDKAPLEPFTLVLDGTLKQDKTSVVQPVALGIHLKTAFTLAIEPATVSLAPDAKQKLVVKLERNPAFTSPVEVNLKNLPPGVTAPNATIPADQTQVEIELTAAKDAKPSTMKNVTADGQASQGQAKFTNSSAPVTVIIP